MMDFNLFGMDDVHIGAEAKPAESRQTTCDLEYDCVPDDILNRKKLDRFKGLRADATGLFPSFHVMPSVVAMLESIGLAIGTASQRNEYPSGDTVSMNCILMQKKFISEAFKDAVLSSKNVSLIDSLAEAYPKHPDFVQIGRPSISPSQVFAHDLSSLAFSSQQIETAFSRVKNECNPLSSVPENDAPFQSDSGSSEDAEDILDAMLGEAADHQDDEGALQDISSEFFADNSIPQYDGGQDDFVTINDLWSEVTYETHSICAPDFEFSEDDTHDPAHWTYEYTPAAPAVAADEVPVEHQKPFVSDPKQLENTIKCRPSGQRLTISPAVDPPLDFREALNWVEEQQMNFGKPASSAPTLSQIEGPTQMFSHGFDPNMPSSSQLSASDNLSILSVEVFGDSMDGLLSNPEHDPILLICWHHLSSAGGNETSQSGLFQLLRPDIPKLKGAIHVSEEKRLFEVFVDFVHKVDPDILCGYEMEKGSWGHLHERAVNLGINLSQALSRWVLRQRPTGHFSESNVDPWELKKTSSFQVFGRICVNVWRVMRSELTLRSYSFEAISLHVLHNNHPRFSQKVLRGAYYGDPISKRIPRTEYVSSYFLTRAKANIDLLVATGTLNRTCEFARLFGVNFYSVLSRGSQFKVESLLLRLAHLENFVAFSPSKNNVVSMRAPEALALVMEPISEMYVDPVVVLDFQALYPSIVIAYNYCFSTCMGKVAPRQAYPKIYGASFLIDSLNDHHLMNIDELIESGQVTVSPNGVAFIGKSVREGIMPKMLTELLEARIAVKAELAKTKDPMKRKILDARQLGLKYISNVTYGYTAASFSGRMPCVEIADSIVQTGRSTLEQAIKWIHENRAWDAHVIYGDTDSLFVRIPGRSRADAHRIGKEIAAYVTSRCPPPVKLKFEKVYFPCFLMSKKRYVGFKYEAAEDGEPVFDAKGIETVRRDNCPLVSKVLEKTLKILARTKDLTQVRQYVQRQFQKVLAGGSKNLADFVFSKEVRLGTYAADRPASTGRSKYNQVESDGDEQMEDIDPEEGQRPHSAIVSLQKMKADPRAVPQYGERIPYVIVYGTGDNNRLRELVASPEELLKNPMLRINSVYYIVKCLVPTLNRVLSLVSADAALWYAEMPRPTSRPINAAAFIRIGKRNPNQPFLDAFFKSSMCLICSARHSNEIRINGESVMLCQDCGRPAFKLDNIRHLVYRLKSIDNELSAFHQVNHHHVGSDGPIANLLELDSSDNIELCCSVDCPMFWKAIALRQYELPLRKSIVSALRIFGLDYS